MIIVRCPYAPKRGLKTQNGRFPGKIALRLNICYKVSFCENCQRKSYRAFIALTIRAKMIGGDVPLNVNFALSMPVPLLGAAALLSRIVTNALFASQLLRWNIKLLTMFIN